MIRSEEKACTVLYIPVGIHDTVHMIRSEESVSCMHTSIYNNVHDLFFSPYHMYSVMYTY
jgi:hypothetical protein